MDYLGAPKKSVCVIDGFMISGRQFCIKNKIYYFHWRPIQKKYIVKSEGYDDFRHNMKPEFFNIYFLETKDFLTEEDMEIDDNI